MEKLSELSNPVGYFIEWQDEETGEKEWCECSKQNGAPLYSQEYVSALLAELEFEKQNNAGVAGMVEDYETKLEAKDEQNKLLMREIEHGKKLRVNMQNNADSLSERIAELEEDRRQLNLIINSEANRADAAEKRVAELSELETHNECLIKKNADLTQQNIKLGERLATPVRLPNKNDDEFWFDGVFQVAKFDRAVERAVSAAGFKFVGEE